MLCKSLSGGREILVERRNGAGGGTLSTGGKGSETVIGIVSSRALSECSCR